MKRITLNFEANAEPKKNGTYPIFLRATEQNRHVKMAVNAWVTNRQHFNSKAYKGSWIASKEPMHKVFNTHLSDTLELAMERMAELERKGELSAKSLIQSLKNGDPHSVYTFIHRKMEHYKALRRVSGHRLLDFLLKKLRAFTKEEDLTFDQITYPFLQDWVAFLSRQTKRNGEPIRSTTVFNHVSLLKTVYRQAEREELVTNQTNPFMHLNLRRGKAQKTSLTAEELQRIIDLDLTKGSIEWHVRNYFLFSIYTAGMRLGDVMRLKWSNIHGDRLEYQMQKTHSPRSLVLTPQSQDILKHYRPLSVDPSDFVFPMLTKADQRLDAFELADRVGSLNGSVNNQLRKIARLADISKTLSFHIARHTFASLAAQQGSVYQVSQLLAHSSLAMTQNYLHELNPKAQDDFLSNLQIP